MSTIQRIKNIAFNKDARYIYFASRGLIPNDSDEKYLKHRYCFSTGQKLNLESPKTFNEKIQWLKLHDRNPIYTQMVDKYEVKEIVGRIIGKQYIIPNLGVWDNFESIDYEQLPNQFVLKTTHDSGGVVIVKDKQNFDVNKTHRVIKKSLSRNYYYSGREWPYKNVKPRIIAEKYMTDESGFELKDYKVFVFGGKPYCIQVDYDRFINHKRNFYSTSWEYLPFTTRYPTDSEHKIECPACLETMLALSKQLAQFLDNPAFIRTDFYINGSDVYFGEITFYHGSGFEKFYPEEYGLKLGELIELEV